MAWRGPSQFGTLVRGRFRRGQAKSLPSVPGPSRARVNVAAMSTKALNANLRMVFVVALAASTIGTLPAVAGPERAHVLVSELTQPPPGWIEFCARQPGECASTMTAPQNLALSRKTWRDLVQVNNWVNETIKPLTDLEHWGVVERWSYPDDGYGDCEDYALLKRRMLIEAGWPREALLLTLVRGPDGEGHAVLTVTTDKCPRQYELGYPALVEDRLPFRQAPIAIRSQRVGLAGRCSAGDRYGNFTVNT